MAVSKTITYTDTNGDLRTNNVTIDLQKIAVGDTDDEEKVYLSISAPGISPSGFWRREIEGLVEDGIFSDENNNETRYTNPPSGLWSGYGDKITNEGVETGASGVPGVRKQLIDLAG